MDGNHKYKRKNHHYLREMEPSTPKTSHRSPWRIWNQISTRLGLSQQNSYSISRKETTMTDKNLSSHICRFQLRIGHCKRQRKIVRITVATVTEDQMC